jgi:hypothetical protein
MLLIGSCASETARIVSYTSNCLGGERFGVSDISHGSLACIVLSVYFAQLVRVPANASFAQLEGIPGTLRRPLVSHPNNLISPTASKEKGDVYFT